MNEVMITYVVVVSSGYPESTLQYYNHDSGLYNEGGRDDLTRPDLSQLLLLGSKSLKSFANEMLYLQKSFLKLFLQKNDIKFSNHRKL